MSLKNLNNFVFFAALCTAPLASAQGLFTATGFGTVDGNKAANTMQAKMMAKRAATLDAQRQLSETVGGVKLTGGTTVKDYEVTSDIVATRIKNVLQGSFVSDSKITQEGSDYLAEVTVAICINDQLPQCKNKPTLESIAAPIE